MHARASIFLASLAMLGLAGCNPFGAKTPEGTATASPSALASVPASAPAATPGAAPPSDSTMTLDFGDDSGKFARDGECDDMRFAGAGMTDTALLVTDIKHDATDCRVAFQQGRLSYKGDNVSGGAPTAYTASGVGHIMWGDDAGKYARDGECDDKRFAGAGMTDTPLLDSDIKHDATDCRVAYEQGRLTLSQ